MPRRSAIGISSSDEDEGFIAVVPELPGCSAFGGTDDALVEDTTAIAPRLETAPADGRSIPEPAGRALNPS